MAAVSVSDIFSVTLVGSVYGQRVMLTNNYKVYQANGGPNVLDLQDLILSAVNLGGANDLVTTYLNCIANPYISEEIWCQRIFPVRSRKSVATMLGIAGIGPTRFTHVAAPLTLYTELAGRGQVSNKHIGPLLTSDDGLILDGMLTQLYKDKFSALGDALTEDMPLLAGETILVPCIVHRTAKPYVITGATEVIGHFTKGAVSSQRTRVVGRGE